MKLLRELRGNRSKPVGRSRGRGQPIGCEVELTVLLLIEELRPSVNRANENGPDPVLERMLGRAVQGVVSTAALVLIQGELVPRIDVWHFLL